jgi:hypothetical protein
MMTSTEAKAFLSHYANTTPAPKKRKQVVESANAIITDVMQLEPVEVIKLKAIVKMAVDGYELYTHDELRIVQTAPSLVALYNTLQGSSLWQSASKKGTLRTNSVRYQASLKEQGPN